MPDRLSYKIGARAKVLGKACRIERHVDVEKVLVVFDDGSRTTAPICDLKPLCDGEAKAPVSVDALSEAELDEARRRLDVIKPLLDISRNITQSITIRARQFELSTSTIYRWLRAFRSNGLLSDLVSDRPKKRKRRLDAKVEAIIRGAIEAAFLTKQKKSKKKVTDEILRQCRAARLNPPHANTIRARLAEISAEEVLRRREGKKAARDRFAPIEGAFPGADYPLAVIQVDHTLLDIIVVDDEHRLPISRPFLTLAIDVFSRMITGYHLSLDAPSVFSVGMCLSNSALSKSDTLLRLGIDGEWPIWGIPHSVHADNGKEFRSKAIQRGCEEYGINLHWRPVKRPHFGGHIERLMGSVAREIHSLPGTTFSNVKMKGEYNSEKTAVMTLGELEKYIVTWIVGVYHQRSHQTIGMPPLAKWREGILGTKHRLGTGMPEPIKDPQRFCTDFLPFQERVVRRDGLVWDHVHYYSEVLRDRINAKKGRVSQKFLVRRDPRDISKLYFLDPEIGEYFEVPYRDLSRPSISIWELREALRRAKAEGHKLVDENILFDAHERLAAIEQEAVATQKRARRKQQRKKAWRGAAILQPDLEPDAVSFGAQSPPVSVLTVRPQAVARLTSVNNDEEYDIPDEDLDLDSMEFVR